MLCAGGGAELIRPSLVPTILVIIRYLGRQSSVFVAIVISIFVAISFLRCEEGRKVKPSRSAMLFQRM